MTAKAKHLMFVMFLAGFSIRLEKALHILKQSPMMLLGDDNDKRLILSFFKDVKEEFTLAAEVIVEEGEEVEDRKTLELIEKILPEIDKAAFKVLNSIQQRTAEEDFQYENLNQICHEDHM